MSEKQQPIGICDLCLKQMAQDQWHTKAGKVRLHCSTECRNTANSRAGREILRKVLLERIANGTFIPPDTSSKEMRRAMAAGVSRRRKQEVEDGTWRNPALTKEARKKLSRPRVHFDNPVLKNAISRLTAGAAMADLTEEEAEEYRAYRRGLYSKRSDRVSQQYRQKQANMNEEERKAQRAKWRRQSRLKREKKKELSKTKNSG